MTPATLPDGSGTAEMAWIGGSETGGLPLDERPGPGVEVRKEGSGWLSRSRTGSRLGALFSTSLDPLGSISGARGLCLAW
jgi:hypothetical protein